MVHIKKKKKKLVRKLNIKGRRELFHSDTVFTKPATSILNGKILKTFPHRLEMRHEYPLYSLNFTLEPRPLGCRALSDLQGEGREPQASQGGALLSFQWRDGDTFANQLLRCPESTEKGCFSGFNQVSS